MDIKISGLGEFLNENERYRVLVAGVPGAGKTPWAAQWPKPLFLAVDKSCAPSLALTQTPRIDCANDRDVVAALDWVAANQGRPSFEHETIVLDTVSVLQERIAQDILRRAGKRDMADVEKGWGQLKSALRAVIDRLTRIDRLHVVVLVHLKDKHDSKEIELDLTGQAKNDLPKEFPFIGHLYMDWKDAEAKTDGEGVVDRDPVRRIAWRANPKFPMLRNPGGILAVTTVDFQPSDFTQISDGMTKGLKILEPKPLGSKVVGEVPEVTEGVQPVPPDVPGGPVEPKVPRPKAAPLKFDPAAHNITRVNDYLTEHPDEVEAVLEAEATGKARRGILQRPGVKEVVPAPQEAREVVREILGGEVVAEERDEIMLAILAAIGAEAMRDLWKKYRTDWTDDHSSAVKERLALLEQEG